MDSSSCQRQKRRGRKIIRSGTAVWTLLYVLELLSVVSFWRISKADQGQAYSSVLTANDGSLLAARIANDGQWRFPKSDSVPRKFATAIRYFEDEQFYYHPGINLFSLLRAFRDNIISGKIRSGGSTITMQLARLTLKNKERNLSHKAQELIFALRLETSFSKKDLLAQYAALAPFGGNVVGLEAASWRYFGRSATQLSWSESALLAVLPNAPGLIFPGKNQKQLLEKRNRLLLKLYQNNCIDLQTYELSLIEPLPGKPNPLPQLAPHLLDRCVQENGAGKWYKSTLVTAIQYQIDQLVNNHIQNLKQNQVHNACVLVADVNSGNILCYVGNGNSSTPEDEAAVDMIKAKRSTGSILKPFLYACMLSENRILPASLIDDLPLRLGAYAPKNFNQTYDGLVPANQAIARSLNVPAVKMLQEYGVKRFHQRLSQFGLKTFTKSSEHYGLSLILGGGEASLFDVAGAYASMGRLLLNFSNTRNNYLSNAFHPLVYQQQAGQETKSQRANSDVLKASAVWYTFLAMTDLLRPQDFVGYQQFASKNRIAWKTGTSFGFRDAWAVGLNANYLVAVWAGNADGEGRPELTGTAAAAPLMFNVFNILNSNKWFPKPFANMQKIKVCTQSGYRASSICPDQIERDMPLGARQSPPCRFHQTIHLDSLQKFRVSSNCYPVNTMKHQTWFVLSPLQEYYFKHHSVWYKPLPAWLPSCQTETSYKHIEIVYPRNDFIIYVPRQFNGKQESCVFSATHKQKSAVLYWHLDGEYIAQTTAPHQYQFNPPPGEHLLLVTDEHGESAQVKFYIAD